MKFLAWGSCVCMCEWQPLEKLEHWLQANLAADHIPLFGKWLDEEAFPVIRGIQDNVVSCVSRVNI